MNQKGSLHDNCINIFVGSKKTRQWKRRSAKGFSVGGETFGVATSLFGCCARDQKPHVFWVNADPVGINIRKKLHGNARGGKFALNYKLTAAMQQMGNGVSQMETLCGFLDITCSTSLRSYIEKAEKVLGKLQLEKTKSSCEEAIANKIKATEEAGALKKSWARATTTADARDHFWFVVCVHNNNNLC